MLLLDQEYINRLSVELNKFKKVSNDVYNFRCPLCGDSTKNHNLARGYFYKGKNGMSFKCHNCGESLYFGQFLKIVNQSLYKEYLLDLFKSKKRPVNKTNEEYDNVNLDEFKERLAKDSKQEKINYFADLPSIESLEYNHPAKQFLLNRYIPKAIYKDLYWAEEFKAFTNSLIPDKFKNFEYDEGRIVIPLRDEFGNDYGYQGRQLTGSNKVKYFTIIVRDVGVRAYGLDKADINQPILVVEGPFDSMFIKNSVAACGSDLLSITGDGYMLDNEPRNPHIVKKYNKLINAGKKVVILPHKYTGMDINDMVLRGMDEIEISRLIGSHIFSGERAKLEMQKWRRC